MKGIGSDRRERLFTNCLQPADKCGEGVRQDKSQVRWEFLTLIFTPSVTAREWGIWRFHRRGWGRRFFWRQSGSASLPRKQSRLRCARRTAEGGCPHILDFRFYFYFRRRRSAARNAAK